MNIADRVKDTSTSTGTGNFTLSGTAPTGFQAMSAIGATGSTFGYVIDNGAEWEVGTGTITAANTFSRAPSASSNAGALVNFSAGTKSVFHVVTAAQFAAFVAPNDIAFSTTVPLLNPGGTYMTGVQSVTGALTFTPAANAVRGAYTFAYLKANGTNIPDVSAFTEHGGSMGYLNTANILNIAEFFNLGGTNWVSWSQAAVPVAAVAPTTVTLTGPTSVVVNTATTNYTVNTDGVRTGPVVVTPTPVTGVTFTPSSVTLAAGSNAGTFTATSNSTGSKTIAVTNNASLTNPSSITLVVSAAATVPDAPTNVVGTPGDTTASFAFTAPAFDGGSTITGYGYELKVYKASDNTLVGTFTGASSPISATGLTNSVSVYGKVAAKNAQGTGAQSVASGNITPVAVSSIRLSPFSSDMTESGSAPWVYSGTGGTYSGSNYFGGVMTKKLPAGVDGYFEIQSTGTGGTCEIMLALRSTADIGSYTQQLISYYSQASGHKYTVFDFSGLSAGSTTNSNIAVAATDRMRIGRSSSGGAANTGVLYAEISNDGGVNWQRVVTTAANRPVTDLYCQVMIGTSPGTVKNITGLNLV